MTTQEILTKAIEKAIGGGWTNYGVLENVRIPIEALDDIILVELITDKYVRVVNYQFIIFNHDFAKALWGEGWNFDSTQPNWEYHLQTMVIADNPIKYLGKNI